MKFEKLKVLKCDELRGICKHLNIRGYSKAKKADLVKMVKHELEGKTKGGVRIGLVRGNLMRGRRGRRGNDPPRRPPRQFKKPDGEPPKKSTSSKGKKGTKSSTTKKKGGLNLFKGIRDGVKAVGNTLKDVFGPDLKNFNPSVKKVLRKYGDKKIKSLSVARKPVSGVIQSAINYISKNGLEKARQKYAYDDIYHLALVVELDSGKRLTVEKNEIVSITEGAPATSTTEYKPVRLVYSMGGYTLDKMLKATIDKVGDRRFFFYDAFNQRGGGNCQRFVMDVLKSNGLLTEALKKFIYQDATGIGESIGSRSRGIARVATDTMGFFRKAIGRGKTKGGRGGRGRQKVKDFFDGFKEGFNESTARFGRPIIKTLNKITKDPISGAYLKLTDKLEGKGKGKGLKVFKKVLRDTLRVPLQMTKLTTKSIKRQVEKFDNTLNKLTGKGKVGLKKGKLMRDKKKERKALQNHNAKVKKARQLKQAMDLRKIPFIARDDALLNYKKEFKTTPPHFKTN